LARVTTPVARLRAFGGDAPAPGSDERGGVAGTARLVGVDIARGLAVLGMFGAHVGVQQPFDWGEPGTWLDVVNGRSSILFAVLAGVSIAIISGRSHPLDGVPLVQARVRILVRAALIFAIGAVLELLGTPVAVILPYYAVLFVMSLPFLRWAPRALFGLAAAVAVVMPIVVFVPRQSDQAVGFGPGQVLVDLLVTGYYPCLVWMAFLLAGLGIGRLDLTALGVQWRMLVAGVGLAVLGYGGAAIAAGAMDTSGRLADLLTSEPHSGSPFEVVGSTGFAIGVIALCLLAARGVLRWVLLPIAAVGSMALSAYSIQIIALAYVVQASDEGPDFLGFRPDNLLWLGFVVVALVACTLWFLLLGRGPFERFLTWVSAWAAGARRRAPRVDALAEAVLAERASGPDAAARVEKAEGER
jgi:uncharacterized membrane protein YeiB